MLLFKTNFYRRRHKTNDFFLISKNEESVIIMVYVTMLSFSRVALQFLKNLNRVCSGFEPSFFDTWQHSLDGRLVCRKVSAYAGQHNTDEDKHPCLERDSNPRPQYPRPTPLTTPTL
jgi:hypothetical protein